MTDILDKKARAQAIEELRQLHIQDLEAIYQSQFAIVQSDEAEDKDKVNAAKNLMTILGVSRPGPEKPPEAPKSATLPAQVQAPLRQDLLDAIDKKIGAK